jgi:hypothetical protein
MQQLLKQLSAATVFVTAAVHADVSDAQVRNLENRVSALEQRKGASGMINPSGRPEVKDGADVFVTADLLVWQAHENGLGYVVKANGPNLTKSHTREPHFNWDPGFRVGFGINTPHDGWDLYANWTYFHTKARSEVSKGTQYPVFANPDYVSGGTATSSNAKWKLNLNMIDVELGREFFVSKWLTLRPFIGLRNAWIYQRMNVGYVSQDVENVGTGPANYYTNMKCQFWGMGVRPGLDTQWGLGSGFSFFGNTSLSLLYGFFHQKQDQSYVQTGATTPTVGNTHSNRVGRVIVETEIGVRFEHMLANDRLHFAMQLGWENLMFFGQNQFDRFTASKDPAIYVANQGDLTIQGYTLSFRLDF